MYEEELFGLPKKRSNFDWFKGYDETFDLPKGRFNTGLNLSFASFSDDIPVLSVVRNIGTDLDSVAEPSSTKPEPNALLLLLYLLLNNH